MTDSDIVNLIGLGIGALGAVLLAYDVVYRPGKTWQADVLKTKLENLRNFRKYNREMIQGIPSPPYTAEEIKTMLDEEQKKWGPEETGLAAKSSTFLTKYEALVVNLGALGVCLIILSFALQFIGVLIHKPGT